MQLVKCMVIGAGDVGKTSLLLTYIQGEFPTHPPTFFDSYHMQVKIEEVIFSLRLWDPCQPFDEDNMHARMRPFTYPDIDIPIVCFSVTEPASFKRVEEYWVPEMKQYCRPNTPFILLGTKVDLRADRAILDKLAEKQEEVVSKEEGKRMAESLKAAKYLECSALTREGVKNVFEEAIRQHPRYKEEMKAKELEKKKCKIL